MVKLVAAVSPCLLTMASAIAIAQPALAADYMRTTLAGTITIQPEQRLIAIGEVVSEATFCERASEMICFRSKDFRFAIPTAPAQRTAWSHDGESYEGKRTSEAVFGRAGPYWLVRQRGLSGLEFLFSDTYGLVVIQAGAQPLSTYVLLQNCGFGAAPDCR